MYDVETIKAMNEDRTAAEFYRSKLKEFYERLAHYEDVDEVLEDMREALVNG